jgi:hypothetical protein
VADPLAKTVCGIGYLGFGRHTITNASRAYGKWSGMLGRVFRPQTKQIKTNYQDCQVHSSWLCFQTFADWYEDQPYFLEDGYELDKDLKKFGNRIYSDEYCSVIPKELNSMLSRITRTNRFGPGVGLVSTGKFTSGITVNGVHQYLGTYETPLLASMAYMNSFKAALIELGQGLHSNQRITWLQLEHVKRFADRISG